MHPYVHAQNNPDHPAYIMADTGETVSYRQLDDRSNQCAHLFRDAGLQVGDLVAICMDNNARYFELCWAAQRAGLYYTCISNKLGVEEVTYIVGNSGAKMLFLSRSVSALAEPIAARCGAGVRMLSVDGEIPGYEPYEALRDQYPAQPIADQTSGADMLYSSGTTGMPKGIRVPLPMTPIDEPNPSLNLLGLLYGFSPASIYLSPAPLYHAAPLRYNMIVHRMGGTSIVMNKFDPEQALSLIEKYQVTHSQWVPTMFVRMLKLPEEVRTRYDLSSHQCAIHAAAPCPRQIKHQMIEWWGPIINEYYAGSEGNGLTALNSEEWLRNEGSVGKTLFGEIHICDDQGEEVERGQEGTVYFGNGPEFEYYNDPDKTAGSRHPKGWSTLGDVGYVNDEGYLFLTDRKANMIISGGVNIYPQETENLLVTHPLVMDVAVFGVPNPDFGEEVKAVVQLRDPSIASPEIAEELIGFCRERLSHIKCPRSIDFEAQLPRHDNGKLYKRLLKDRYWKEHDSRIG